MKNQELLLTCITTVITTCVGTYDGEKNVDVNPGYIQAFEENEKEKKDDS